MFDEEAEEGEIGPVDDYNPAFEYPGGNEVSQYAPQPRRSSLSPPAASATNITTIFRLIALRSTVLARSRRVAALDGHTEVSIGRDVTTSARVRLKEMAVSKFHASIYWDGSRREWGIVDMGSMHGTYVRSARDPSTSATASQTTPGTRLSEPRKASMPKVLRHHDEITIGGTTFLVHEHLTGRPCPDCTIEGDAEIPLFSTRAGARSNAPSDEQSRKRKYVTDGGERDAKKTMAKLKSSLLSRHALPSALPSGSNVAYKDRSARRRELHPEPRLPSLPTPTRTDSEPALVPPTPRASSPPPPTPPPPVPSSNIGHRLLQLQGWNPGMTLGEDPDIGLLEPLHLSSNASRAGLGSSVQTSHPDSQAPENWKEEAKRRRWDGMKAR
ncbi:hypothetical protein JB92DRAFT_2695774 [Gautieria morchelliformis]|nr:hypothetical protein JB92DRAFT_2695774 [Gautieria morchelliformis]